MSSWAILCGLLALTAQLTVGQYVNDDWDTDFEFECETGEHIYYATSKFDGTTRSRKWGFDCRYGFVSDDCWWTDWLNYYCDNNGKANGAGDSGINYDGNKHEGFDAKCDDNGIVTGFKGVHQVTGKDKTACNGNTRDYLWKMKCCKPNTKISNQATNLGGTGRTSWYTEAIGERRGLIDYSLYEDTYTIYGLIGKYHEDGDREFRFRVNERSKCWAKNMTITNSPPTVPTDMKVVGLAVGLNCNPDANMNLEQGDIKEVTTSKEITTETTHDFTFERSVTVETEVNVAGATAGIGFSASVGGGFGFGKSTTIGTSKTHSTSAMLTVDYSGPMAVMVRGYQEEYKVEDDTADVLYGVQCENGDTFSQSGSVKISTQSYGRTHWATMSFTFYDKQTCIDNQAAIEACLSNLSGGFDDGEDASYFQTNFVKCFYVGADAMTSLKLGYFKF